MDTDLIANIVAQITDSNTNDDRSGGALLDEHNLNNDEISFIKSEKGNDMAVHRGHHFMNHKGNRDGTTQYWVCAKANTSKCKARLHTLADGNVFKKFVNHDANKAHSHDVDPVAVAICTLKSNIKQRAIESREKPKQLLKQELQSVPIAVALRLSKGAIRKQVRRIRKKNQLLDDRAHKVEMDDVGDAIPSTSSQDPIPLDENIMESKPNKQKQEAIDPEDLISTMKSERGNDMAIHRGHQFMKQGTNRSGTKQYWQCAMKASGHNQTKCRARLHTLAAGNVFHKFVSHDVNNAHNHAVDPMALELRTIKANIKQRAIETQAKPQQLLNQELQSASLSVACNLSREAIRKQVMRARRKSQLNAHTTK